MSQKLLDYSFARPDPQNIKNQGYSGVMRYVSPNASKNLTTGERDALRNAGLSIGLVWEWYANRANEGHDAGVQDATAAVNQANALGFPAYLPIYFAVDWDAAEDQQGNINAYFQGVRQVFSGKRKVGAYAGYWPLKRLFDAQLIDYGWQTYAWSGGQSDPRAQIRQVLNGQWGGQVDFNETTTDDWGGWTTDQKPQPVDPPASLPMPTAGNYTIKKGDTFWGLEAQNGWTHGVLQNLNPSVNPNTLQIGSTIRVPGGEAQAAAGSGQHTIVKGDTFWGLEAANSWPHGTLQGLNPGLNPTTLQVGQVIKTPGGSQSPAPAVASQAKHTIVSGDTFWGLETANGWGHGTLQSMNPGVEPTKLQIGQQINVPG